MGNSLEMPDYVQALTVRTSELHPLFDKGWNIARQYFGNTLGCYAPGMVHYNTRHFTQDRPWRFPGISVTGRKCALNCAHCNHKLLDSMIPAKTPETLLKIVERIKEEGGQGCLISGGAKKDGSVPLGKFTSVIKKAKEEFSLKIVVHTGLVVPDLVEKLADIGIDAVMLDVVGSEETIRDVFRLKKGKEDYERSLELLHQAKIPTVPHIVVGLHYGKIKGEPYALQMVSKYKPAAVVIVALMPLEGTEMEHVAPPSPLEITRIVLSARLLMPQTPLILGCARPLGAHKERTDRLSIDAGLNGIAYPSETGVDYALKRGLNVDFSPVCCSLMFQTFFKNKIPP
ncbi:MAG: radical SAM protein [Candidatus Heimdallarchaeota archaeon]